MSANTVLAFLEEQGSDRQAKGRRRRFRLAILTSHVIQYQGPLYRRLASHPCIDLHVFFCSESGLNTYKDVDFGQEIKWDIDLLEGYNFEFLRNWSPSPNLATFWGLINPAIISKLRKGNFDAVLVHGWARCTNWIAIITALLSGIPVLMRGETNLLNRLPRWKEMLKQSVLVPLFKCMAGFLVIGSCNREFYQKYGVPASKLFTAPYTVNNDFFLMKAKEFSDHNERTRSELGIKPNLPIILFCGKLTQVKRPFDLLKAFESLQREAALVFVGDGPFRYELQKEVTEKHIHNVRFAGFRNQSELPKYFSASDVFVLPSEYEPWGLVVNEAMCFGLPIIVSDRVGSAADLIRKGETGFIFDNGQTGQLSKLLATLVRDPEKRKQMGKNSRARIQHWSYEEDIEAVLSCLRATCGEVI